MRDLITGALACMLFVSGAFFLWAATLKIPDVQSVEDRKVSQSAKIYDRTGTVLLYDLNQNVTRSVVPIEEISVNVRNATVAIEDAEFYKHHGIKVTAIIRAILANLIPGGYTQGGSTITQQVVKNSVLTIDKTLARKLKEWVVAVRLERVLTKDEILGLYLNESPYGGSVYGVEEAARAFFRKPARDLSLAESAYLAALPQAPTYYSPYGNHRDALEDRKNLVLSRMRDLDFITEDEYRVAKGEIVAFESQAVSGIRAPHFVFFVREQLEQEFGRRALEESGWRIVTSLDMDLQDAAERIVKEYALKNEKDFNAENAALVAIDPKTGDVLALVGSRDYFDTEIDGNYNVAVARPGRQPGSAFKPFVYAEALQKGYTPDTVVFDLKTQFSSECAPDDFSDEAPCYSPENYDHIFRGPTTLRNALAQSVNIVAVKVLYLVGIENAIRLARSLGISTLTNADQYGLTLVLGGGEVTLLDMVSAYATFAAEGERHPYRPIIKIEDRAGAIVKEYPATGDRVLDENIAWTISDMLSDNVARIPAFGANSPLYFPGQHVAAKTGTTNDSRDAWIIGYSPNIAAGAWAGNNDNSPMVRQVAGFIVAPMWHAFMVEALKNYPNDPFPEPRALAGENDKPVLRGIWADPAIGVHSILFWLNKDDPRGPRPQNPADDRQFDRWEYAVRLWAAQHGVN